MKSRIPEHLISAFLEDELDEDQATELSAWVTASPENARYLSSLVVVERGLVQHNKKQLAGGLFFELAEIPGHDEVWDSVVDQALAERRKDELEDRANALLADQQAELAKRRRLQQPRTQTAPARRTIVIPTAIVWLSLAAAALFAVWVGGVILSAEKLSTTIVDQQGEESSPAATQVTSVASIRSSVDARWRGHAYEDHDDLAIGGRITLQEGLVEVVFGDGTLVFIEGPATFEPNGPGGLRLVSGRMTARVPEGVTGFQVETASGLVTDHGTEFGVYVGPDGRTVALAFSGRITLAPSDGAGGWRTEQEVRLLAGDAAESTPSGQVQAVEPTPLTFVRETEFGARRDAEVSPYTRWLAYRYQLLRDADVVAYYVFDRDDFAAGALVNRAVGGDKADDGRLGNGGEVASPRWVDGRFPQTRALRFGRADTGQTYGVVIPDSNALDLDAEMSLALWIRAHSPVSFYGTLLSKRSVPPSRMNYQVAIMRYWVDGGHELQFGAGRDEESVAGFAYSPATGYLAEPGWHHVVITADTTTIRYYLNGELVHTASQPMPPLTNDADLLIGTSPAGLVPPIANGADAFQGDISEVLIAKRVFNEIEIQALYDNSRGTP